MHTLAPPCTMPEENLSQPQQRVLHSLVLGKTVSQAATEAGIHRNTVHRWLREDKTFQAAKDDLQHDAQRAVEAKLHDTAMIALDCIEQCLEQGDAYVAEQLLKGLGCYSGELSNLGSEDAVELAQEAMRQGAIAEMLGGFHGNRQASELDSSDFGGRKSAQAERESDEDTSDHLQHSATWEAKSEVGDRRSAQAEGEAATMVQDGSVQPTATSDDAPEPCNTNMPDLSEMERYASVFNTPDEPSENPQPCATSPDPLMPTSDLRLPALNLQPFAPFAPRAAEAKGEPHVQHDAPAERENGKAESEERKAVQAEEESCGGDQVQPCATSDDRLEPGFDAYSNLTDQQTLAMFALQTGQTIDQAAEEAETESATVYGWLYEDHTFRAAMNRCAQERRQAIKSRLMQLASLAASVIQNKVRLGNGRLAVRMLRGLGYLAA